MPRGGRAAPANPHGLVVAMTKTLRLVLLAALFLVLPAVAGAQRTGRLVGKVIDAEAGVPIGGAEVAIAGSALRTVTTVDGRYEFRAVPVDTVSLRVRMIGYAPKTVTGIVLTGGGVTEQDVTMAAAAVEIQAITVTAASERGSVNSALDAERNSVAIVNSISAEQIARSPDGDAAAAVQRVSGATVQDGKYVSVRGLGDRYTQASLNGARIPSPEPERKVVPLDLFPSSLLAAITTSKTFTPDQSGDFSGALVNITTKDFPGKRFVGMSVSGGYNDAVTFKDARFAPAAASDWLALGAGNRRLPAAFDGVDFSRVLTPAQTNTLVNALRDVWTPGAQSGAPNGSLGLSLGGNMPLGGTTLRYAMSGTYSNSTEVRADEVRALARTVSSGQAEEQERFRGSTGRNSVLWGGIANVSTTLGLHTSVALNNTYNRTMDNEGRRETGTSENYNIPLLVERTRYVERNIYSSQLSVHHEVGGGRLGIDWGGTLSGVRRREPDRSEFVYSLETGTPTWFGFSNEAAVRTFGNLTEDSREAHADLTWTLGSLASNQRIRVGGLYRSARRDATNDVYSISLTRPLPGNAGELPPEAIFGGTYSSGDDNYFRIVPLAAGGSYGATERLTAGYAMLITPLGQSFDLIGGARLEHDRIEVRSLSTVGEASMATPTFTDVLPSLALTWRAREDMNIRLSGTQTLSRPEYRELSPILYREVLGGDNVKGNADLQRALIQNYDLRWEWYPRSGEILSVALFAKTFNHPIERVYQGTSGTNIITYVNARGANNTGVELEARKRLDLLAGPLRTFTLFANATLMKSEIKLDPAAGSFTNAQAQDGRPGTLRDQRRPHLDPPEQRRLGHGALQPGRRADRRGRPAAAARRDRAAPQRARPVAPAADRGIAGHADRRPEPARRPPPGDPGRRDPRGIPLRSGRCRGLQLDPVRPPRCP